MKKLLSVKEVAVLLACSERKVRRLVDEGELIAGKLGSSPNSALRIQAESLDAFWRRAIVNFQNRDAFEEDFVSTVDK